MKWEFSDRQLQFPTEEIMVAQNYALNAPKWGIFSPKLCILKVVQTRRKVSDRLIFFWGGGGIARAMTPLYTVPTHKHLVPLHVQYRGYTYGPALLNIVLHYVRRVFLGCNQHLNSSQ